MTLSVAPPSEAVAATMARRDHMADLGSARAFFNSHPRARVPASPVVSVRVRGNSREEKLADLRAIAVSWEVPVETLPDGTMTAQLVFGGLTYEAHVGAEYPTTTAWLNAQRARRGGTGAAA